LRYGHNSDKWGEHIGSPLPSVMSIFVGTGLCVCPIVIIFGYFVIMTKPHLVIILPTNFTYTIVEADFDSHIKRGIKMEEVVYFLGAGFSAPFGIPVMSNFLVKSKDMFSKNSDKYKHLKRIFDEIDKMDKINRFYSMDVDNIEDVLSILEMNEHIGIGIPGFKKTYTDYIKAVIEYYTPKQKTEEPRLAGPGWFSRIFGYEKNDLGTALGFFVASIHNLSFQRELQRSGENIVRFNRDFDLQTHYSIITLNYDLLLENICRFIDKKYSTNGGVTFATDIHSIEVDNTNPILAKLHGSIDTTIVPPTWNKSDINPNILNAWKLAYKALVEANYIQIIGYSFPATDTYVKYLLSSAVMKAFNLKKIDVICKDDSNGTIRKKYKEFINFKYYRFINGDVREYLFKNYDVCCHPILLGDHPKKIVMNGLEKAHEAFFI